jgi:hypothetical protein
MGLRCSSDQEHQFNMKPILTNFITSHLPQLLLVGIALCCPPLVSSAEEGRPVEQALWEKALSDNTKDVVKARAAYQKALSEASARVVKSLETSISDLNNPQKVGALGMKERAAAIKALEGRVTAVKEQGAVSEFVTAVSSAVPDKVIHGAFVKSDATHIIALRRDKTFYFSWLNQRGNYTISGDRVILNGDESNYFTLSKDGKKLTQGDGKNVFNLNTEAIP